jgi:hypothetical protein
VRDVLCTKPCTVDMRVKLVGCVRGSDHSDDVVRGYDPCSNKV